MILSTFMQTIDLEGLNPLSSNHFRKQYKILLIRLDLTNMLLLQWQVTHLTLLMKDLARQIETLINL